MDEAIKEAEAAGFFWAVERNRDGVYTAVVQRSPYYTGEALSGPGAVGGTTPADALRSATAKELKYEAEQASRQR